MPSALRVDQLGGANFGGYHLRNVASLHVGGSALATATFQVTGNALVSAELTASRFVSTVATGTAPLTVTSTTKVTNLNVDQLDGLDSTDLVTIASKGVANGVAPLDASAKIDTVYLPSTIVGSVEYQGTWDASLGTAPSASPGKGDYYVVNVAGATNLSGITDWKLGDWAIYNGTAWEKVDNSESVTSVAGRTGAITLQAGDYPAMVGADGTNAGTRGAVPAPTATDNTKYLRGDGTWASAGGTVVAARYTTNAGLSIPHNSVTRLDFEDLVYDTDGRVTIGASWVFTAAEAGYYSIQALIEWADSTTWGAAEPARLYCYVNGILINPGLNNQANLGGVNDRKSASFSTTLHMNAGDTMYMGAYQASGGALPLYADGRFNYVSITKHN